MEQDRKLSEVKKDILSLRTLKEVQKGSGGGDQENHGNKSSNLISHRRTF